MLNLLVVRHGETVAEIKRNLAGHRQISISNKGEKDAEKIGEKIKKFDIDQIYSSDLKRTKETAEIIKEVSGFSGKIRKSKQIREMDFGDYTGEKKQKVIEKDPRFLKDSGYKSPRGESYAELKERVLNFIEGLEERHEGKKILLVMHRGPMMALRCEANDLNFDDNLMLEVKHNYIGKFILDKDNLIECSENVDEITYEELAGVNEQQIKALTDLYETVDEEFTPPLSERGRTIFERTKEISEDSTWIVAKDENFIIGSCAANLKKNRSRSLAVHPFYRKAGIGTKLLEKVIMYFKNKDSKYIKFRTSSDHKQITKMAEKFGFELDKRIKNPQERPKGIDTLWFKKELNN